MKNAYFWFISLVFVSVLFSCSKDDYEDPGFIIPDIPGQNLEPDDVQIVFVPEEGKTSINFECRLQNRAVILINWGDDNELYPHYCVEGELVTHDYTLDQREYIITIKAPKLVGLYLTHDGCDQITSVFCGECPELREVLIPMLNNKLKNLDIAKCQQISEVCNFNIFDPEFDFNGLKNIVHLTLNMYCNYIPVIIDDFACKYLLLNVVGNGAKEITVRNCPNLKTLHLAGFSREAYHSCLVVDKMDLSIGSLETMQIDQLVCKDKLDFTQLSSLSSLKMAHVDCYDTIELPNSLTSFRMYNEAFTSAGVTQLAMLDFRHCKELQFLDIQYIRGLKKIYYDGLKNLNYINIENVGEIEDYRKE